MSDSDIRRYSAEQLREMVARGESLTDWARVEAMTEEELERSIADDPDWKDLPEDWIDHAVPVMPGPKQLVSLRIDQDVLAWFRAQGAGYQTRMNAALRAYADARRGKP